MFVYSINNIGDFVSTKLIDLQILSHINIVVSVYKWPHFNKRNYWTLQNTKLAKRLHKYSIINMWIESCVRTIMGFKAVKSSEPSFNYMVHAYYIYLNRFFSTISKDKINSPMNIIYFMAAVKTSIYIDFRICFIMNVFKDILTEFLDQT